jgi:hypothetical protein
VVVGSTPIITKTVIRHESEPASSIRTPVSLVIHITFVLQSYSATSRDEIVHIRKCFFVMNLLLFLYTLLMILWEVLSALNGTRSRERCRWQFVRIVTVRTVDWRQYHVNSLQEMSYVE